jgi:hypothetical protein
LTTIAGPGARRLRLPRPNKAARIGRVREPAASDSSSWLVLAGRPGFGRGHRTRLSGWRAVVATSVGRTQPGRMGPVPPDAVCRLPLSRWQPPRPPEGRQSRYRASSDSSAGRPLAASRLPVSEAARSDSCRCPNGTPIAVLVATALLVLPPQTGQMWPRSAGSTAHPSRPRVTTHF